MMIFISLSALLCSAIVRWMEIEFLPGACMISLRCFVEIISLTLVAATAAAGAS
jgi:hypothetical protein